MIEVKSYEFAKELQSKTCVVDFHASWCTPCKAIAPILDEIHASGVDVYKIDIDDQELLAGQFGVRSVPTVMFFREGKIVETLIGSMARARFFEAADKLR